MDKKRINLLIEWLFWCGFVALLWAQTGAFSEIIAEYKFGASGWPKGVLIGLLIGATGQALVGYMELGKLGGKSASAPIDSEPKRKIRRHQQILIFVLPLFYLWLMHRIGFFVATPLFIMAYLRVLEVKAWRYLLGVTGVVYLFVLFVFVRLFYVALPVGAWPTFYDINNQIISIVRIGL